MQERREGDLSVPDPLRGEPQRGLTGQQREVVAVPQHADSSQVDVDEMVEVAELVELRHAVRIGWQIVDAVATSEGEQSPRVHRPLQVDVQLHLGQRVDEPLVAGLVTARPPPRHGLGAHDAVPNPALPNPASPDPGSACSVCRMS